MFVLTSSSTVVPGKPQKCCDRASDRMDLGRRAPARLPAHGQLRGGCAALGTGGSRRRGGRLWVRHALYEYDLRSEAGANGTYRFFPSPDGGRHAASSAVPLRHRDGDGRVSHGLRRLPPCVRARDRASCESVSVDRIQHHRLSHDSVDRLLQRGPTDRIDCDRHDARTHHDAVRAARAVQSPEGCDAMAHRERL